MNTATSFSTTRPPTGWHTNNITISQNKPEDTSVGDFPDPSKPIIGTDPTPGNNLTTTNDVFNMIRGLGNFSVIVGELHPSRNHPSHTVSGRELLNYANTLFISPQALQLMADNPEFREKILFQIYHYFNHNEGNNRHSLAVDDSGMAFGFLAKYTAVQPEPTPGEGYEEPLPPKEETVYSLGVNLAEKFAKKFADRGHILAMENEMYLLDRTSSAYDKNAVFAD